MNIVAHFIAPGIGIMLYPLWEQSRYLGFTHFNKNSIQYVFIYQWSSYRNLGYTVQRLLRSPYSDHHHTTLLYTANGADIRILTNIMIFHYSCACDFVLVKRKII